MASAFGIYDSTFVLFLKQHLPDYLNKKFFQTTICHAISLRSSSSSIKHKTSTLQQLRYHIYQKMSMMQTIPELKMFLFFKTNKFQLFILTLGLHTICSYRRLIFLEIASHIFMLPRNNFDHNVSHIILRCLRI